MSTNPKTFTLPTMPFRREISSGCPVGTTIKITGKPYEDVSKSVILSLFTNNNDTALRVELILGQPTKIKIDCIVSQKSSTAIENYVVCPLMVQAQLMIKTMQHSFEIFFNNSKIADFVHRVDPNLIKSILVSGPLINEEVRIENPVAAPLPSYEQATSPPVDLMSSMSISGLKSNPNQNRQNINDLPPPPQSVLNPTAPPAQFPIGTLPNSGVTATSSAPSAPPMPPVPSTTGTSTTSSSFFYTGNSQGFSNHPYPLPGLIDNSTHASQQNPVGTLQQGIPNNSGPTAPPQMAPVSTGAYVSAPVTHPPPSSSSSNLYSHTPITSPTVPYTVTFPQTAASTPAPGAQPQIPPPNIQNPIYQNQMHPGMGAGYNPYPQYPPQQVQPPVMVQPTVIPPTTAVAPTTVIPTGTAVQPYNPMMAGAVVPQPYMYPTAMQPYPVYQQYQQYPAYGYPEVIYYDGGHHHHRHHFFGHHHHHCD